MLALLVMNQTLIRTNGYWYDTYVYWVYRYYCIGMTDGFLERWSSPQKLLCDPHPIIVRVTDRTKTVFLRSPPNLKQKNRPKPAGISLLYILKSEYSEYRKYLSSSIAYRNSLSLFRKNILYRIFLEIFYWNLILLYLILCFVLSGFLRYLSMFHEIHHII